MAVKEKGKRGRPKIPPEPIREELGKSSATADSVAAAFYRGTFTGNINQR
jgi:hypothetical protein